MSKQESTRVSEQAREHESKGEKARQQENVIRASKKVREQASEQECESE